MNMKKALLFGFFTAFLILGIVSMKRAMPDAKEERIYSAIKVYSPYYVEKRVGGLTILDKTSDKKEKPSASEIFHRLDELNKEWGNKNLMIEENMVVIMGENNQSIARIMFESEKEKNFVKRFFGI